MANQHWELIAHGPRLRTPPPPAHLPIFRHHFIDQDKPYTGTDILTTDVDNDGLPDVICGAWWYQNPTWERYKIPGIYQAHFAYDIDGDGREELIATKAAPHKIDDWYQGLTSRFCWLKPIDPISGQWEEHPIGTGHGNWPHGVTITPVLPDGRLALIIAFHSVHLGENHYPLIFEIPDDPTQYPWKSRVLAEILYGEEITAHDMNSNQLLDLVAGPYWLENKGDGTFRPHQFAERVKVSQMARLRIMDVNGSGCPDIVIGEQNLDFKNRVTPLSRLVWFEHPGNLDSGLWLVHVIDQLRCPHSLDVADLDGDGELEIVCAEHDPFKPYNSGCRLFVYKKADPSGTTWYRRMLDDRFEHHNGTVIFEVEPGRLAIASHGWAESRYVHLWEITPANHS